MCIELKTLLVVVDELRGDCREIDSPYILYVETKEGYMRSPNGSEKYNSGSESLANIVEANYM